jgi:hypothetical protein
MRSTKGSALDPTRAGSSASSPPPVRPPLHLASTSVLFWPPHDSLLLRHAPTAGEAKCAIRTVRELFGHQDVRTTLTCTYVLNRGGQRVRRPADTP